MPNERMENLKKAIITYFGDARKRKGATKHEESDMEPKKKKIFIIDSESDTE